MNPTRPRQRPPQPDRKSTRLGVAIGQVIWTQRVHVTGESQTDLADRIGRSQATISAWERGRHVPSWGELRLLADALGVPMETFVRLVVQHTEPEAA